jgi:hypothetical protein
LRRQSPRPGDQWHLDEVFLKINGRLHYLWRAVDQDGDVLDILIQSRRDKKAAKKFFRKLLKGLRYVPRVIITDKLKSYSAARAELMSSVEHDQHKYQNNRAENSHQPRIVGNHGEVYRRGGEEIIAILPYVDLKRATEIAERILEEVSSTAVQYENDELHATLSVGLAASPPHDPDGPGLETHAENALKQTKNSGKNCLIVG